MNSYYRYKNKHLLGVFNVGLEEGSIQVDLKDGQYINEITQSMITVKNQRITLSKEPIIIKY